jgi:hypothetical protein
VKLYEMLVRSLTTYGATLEYRVEDKSVKVYCAVARTGLSRGKMITRETPHDDSRV